jgi:hypothetical protein
VKSDGGKRTSVWRWGLAEREARRGKWRLGEMVVEANGIYGKRDGNEKDMKGMCGRGY